MCLLRELTFNTNLNLNETYSTAGIYIYAERRKKHNPARKRGLIQVRICLSNSLILHLDKKITLFTLLLETNCHDQRRIVNCSRVSPEQQPNNFPLHANLLNMEINYFLVII